MAVALMASRSVAEAVTVPMKPLASKAAATSQVAAVAEAGVGVPLVAGVVTVEVIRNRSH